MSDHPEIPASKGHATPSRKDAEAARKKALKPPVNRKEQLKRDREARKRIARSWFAESLGWMPVQIEQSEKKGDTFTLKLVSVHKD